MSLSESVSATIFFTDFHSAVSTRRTRIVDSPGPDERTWSKAGTGLGLFVGWWSEWTIRWIDE